MNKLCAVGLVAVAGLASMAPASAGVFAAAGGAAAVVAVERAPAPDLSESRGALLVDPGLPAASALLAAGLEHRVLIEGRVLDAWVVTADPAPEVGGGAGDGAGASERGEGGGAAAGDRSATRVYERTEAGPQPGWLVFGGSEGLASHASSHDLSGAAWVRDAGSLRSRRPVGEFAGERERITYEHLYGSLRNRRPGLGGSPVRLGGWLDGSSFRLIEGGEWAVDARTGERERLSREQPRGAAAIARRLTESGMPGEAVRSWARALASMDAEDTRVFEYSGDLFAARGDGSGAMRLTGTAEEERVAEMNPQRTAVAYVRGNDLYISDLRGGGERAVTDTDVEHVLNGLHTWVYYEELYGRNWRAFWWSPSGEHIAFLQTSEAGVPRRTIVDDRRRTQRMETEAYPLPGEANPHVELWVAPRDGSPRLVDLSRYDPGAYLISAVRWTPDGRLVLMVQDRAQTWLDMLVVGAEGGRPERLMRQRTGAWVQPPMGPWWFEDGRFLTTDPSSGSKRLAIYRRDGRLARHLTPDGFDVKRVERVDEEGGFVWFMASRDQRVGLDLYRVSFDGGSFARLTDGRGVHRVDISPDGSLFIDRWSNVNEPTKTAVRDSEGKLLRWVDTNPVDLSGYALGEIELTQFQARDGVVLPAILVRPPAEAGPGPYPVLVRTYAGPGYPSVEDSRRRVNLYDHMMASQGVMVVIADPLSSMTDRLASSFAAYRQLGVREARDLEDCARWVDSMPEADGERIALVGHSYGGYITAFTMTQTDAFAGGVAGAPVTDWRDYDSIYTERYMDTPQNNPDGYRAGSVVEHASKLSGRLLIAHGLLDDNVRFEQVVRLIDALQRADKDFELMVYPGYRHGIGGRHYPRLRYEFLMEVLKPGSGSGSGSGGSSGEPSDAELAERDGR